MKLRDLELNALFRFVEGVRPSVHQLINKAKTGNFVVTQEIDQFDVTKMPVPAPCGDVEVERVKFAPLSELIYGDFFYIPGTFEKCKVISFNELEVRYLILTINNERVASSDEVVVVPVT